MNLLACSWQILFQEEKIRYKEKIKSAVWIKKSINIKL